MSGEGVGPEHPVRGDLSADASSPPGPAARRSPMARGTANAAPSADAQARPTDASVGEVVTFDGSGSTDDRTPAADLEYAWDFGDGDAGDRPDRPPRLRLGGRVHRDPDRHRRRGPDRHGHRDRHRHGRNVRPRRVAGSPRSDTGGRWQQRQAQGRRQGHRPGDDREHRIGRRPGDDDRLHPRRDSPAREPGRDRHDRGRRLRPGRAAVGHPRRQGRARHRRDRRCRRRRGRVRRGQQLGDARGHGPRQQGPERRLRAVEPGRHRAGGLDRLKHGRRHDRLLGQRRHGRLERGDDHRHGQERPARDADVDEQPDRRHPGRAPRAPGVRVRRPG